VMMLWLFDLGCFMLALWMLFSVCCFICLLYVTAFGYRRLLCDVYLLL